MDKSSDSNIDIDLPDSPSDASLSNISTPTPIEDNDINLLNEDVNNNNSNHSKNTLLSSQLQRLSQQHKEQKGNGRVYEFSQDGKVKLKISLKGLNNTVDNNNNNTSQSNSQITDTTEYTLISQSANPPINGSNNNNNNNNNNNDNDENNDSEKNHIEDNNGIDTGDDEFSDDISFSQIDSNSVQVLDLSPLVTVMKHPTSFNVKLKLTPTMKIQLQNDAILQRQNILKEIESKRIEAKLKFAAKQKEKAQAKAQAKAQTQVKTTPQTKKPRTKSKRRLKPKYSRYMVNMSTVLPLRVPGRDEIYFKNFKMMKDASFFKGSNITNNNIMDIKAITSTTLTESNPSYKEDGKAKETTTTTTTTTTTAATNSTEDDDDEIIEKYVRLSLKDPLSGSRMVTPLRSIYCSHVECFDYESFLIMNNLKPFKIAIQRYTEKPAKIGNVDVMKILEDTKRPVLSPKERNKMTSSFEYSTRDRYLQENKKQRNELGWFCCPICKLEFNIKVLGDIYVVGEFVDLLQDLEYEENNEDIEDIEINMFDKGKWRWIRDTENDSKFGNHNSNSALNNNDNNNDSNNNNEKIENSQINTNNSTFNNNSNNGVELRNNVEVVTLDSDDEIPGEAPSASENIINALEPLIKINNLNTSEDEMMKQIDALFDAEIMGVDDTAPSTSSTPVPSVSPSLPKMKQQTPIHSNNNFSNPNIIDKDYNNLNNKLPPTLGSFFTNNQNKHRGVVQFRPGAFTTPTINIDEQTPVFMRGEGVPDDPIILD